MALGAEAAVEWRGCAQGWSRGLIKDEAVIPGAGRWRCAPVISAGLGCRFADRADHATARRDPDLGRLLEAEGAVVLGAAWWVCRARVGHGLVHGAGVKRAERSSSSAGKTGLTAGPAGQRLKR